MKVQITQDSAASLTYPIYGHMFRSVAASFPVRWLFERAGREGFLEELEKEYLPSKFVLEPPTTLPSRGNILLVHGSAPFNLDGRIPVPHLDSPYAKTDFYKDLSLRLRAAGYGVLRYSKLGVRSHGVDGPEYAKSDVAALSRQLHNLWRFLPADQPRIVFAWSEGTLHVRALPIAQMDALILFGGISTNIADIIRAQGGPSAEVLLKELAGKDRTQMLGLDRPVGRVVDELALTDNWKSFEPFEQLPILVLHGTADREVPVAQAATWKDALSHHRATLVQEQGLEHRFMVPGTYDVAALGAEVTKWLEAALRGQPIELELDSVDIAESVRRWRARLSPPPAWVPLCCSARPRCRWGWLQLRPAPRTDQVCRRGVSYAAAHACPGT